MTAVGRWGRPIVDMECPNPDCTHLRRYGFRLNIDPGVSKCPACGASAGGDDAMARGEVEFLPLETVATFSAAHAAHLARGRLEAEGFIARVIGEHLGGARSHCIDDRGGVALKVPAGQADMAREILLRNAPEEFLLEEDAELIPEEVENAPSAPRVCPKCASASVFDVRETNASGPRARLMRGIRSIGRRRYRCFTCNHRWS